MNRGIESKPASEKPWSTWPRRKFLQVMTGTLAGAALTSAFPQTVTAEAPQVGVVSTLPDHEWPTGAYYSQAGEGKGGFAISDEGVFSPNEGAFYSFFKANGGVDVFGFPNSGRFTIKGEDGFLFQGFQKQILQFNKNTGEMSIANTMDLLHEYGFDDQMVALGIPKHFTGDDGSHNFDEAKAIRTGAAWITDSDIRNLYFTNPDPNNKGWDSTTNYGLPTSKVEKIGPFLVLRCQRAVLMKVVEPGTGQPVGATTVTLAGDIAKKVGLIPQDAAQPSPYAVGNGVAGSHYPEFVLATGVNQSSEASSLTSVEYDTVKLAQIEAQLPPLPAGGASTNPIVKQMIENKSGVYSPYIKDPEGHEYMACSGHLKKVTYLSDGSVVVTINASDQNRSFKMDLKNGQKVTAAYVRDRVVPIYTAEGKQYIYPMLHKYFQIGDTILIYLALNNTVFPEGETIKICTWN